MAFNCFLRCGIEGRKLVGSQFLSFSRFSTLHDKLFGLVESDYSRRSSPFLEKLSLLHSIDLNDRCLDEFPFGIEENRQLGKKLDTACLLRRRYNDEIIEVGVSGYEVDGFEDTPRISLNVHLLRGTQYLMFEMIAQPNLLNIETCTIKDTVTGHVKAFQKYLQTRGFTSSMINYLLAYAYQHSNAKSPPRLIPYGFPFAIENVVDWHEKGDVLRIRRSFRDELIRVDVSGLPTCSCDIQNKKQKFKMSVKIDPHHQIRESRESQDFEISVISNLRKPIFIHQVTRRAERGHLKDFQKFWEVRGIKPSTTNLLFDYFNKKVQQNFPRFTGLELLPKVPTF